MPWDAFISYKSEDRVWALKLKSWLARQGLSAFVDFDNLIAGGDWKSQLQEQLNDSKALVVLWSTKAATQERLGWLDTERFLFDLPQLYTPRINPRPTIFVLLDARPQSLADLHHVTDLFDGGHYPNGIGAVPDATWGSVASKLAESIDLGNGLVRVKTLVLAATRQELTERALGAGSWNELQRQVVNLRLAANDIEAFLDERYSDSPSHWRPYGGQTIEELITTLRDELAQDDGPRLRFEPTGGEFLSGNVQVVRQEVRKLARELALIIIDPLSLRCSSIETCIAQLTPCIESRTNAIALLSTSNTNDSPINDLIAQSAASGLYNLYYRPPIPSREDQSTVGMHIRNPAELIRVLLLAVGRQSRRTSGAPVIPHPITGWGSR